MKKLEQILFYFLLFAIPFQTRKILWHQNWNFNEWQSISIYGTDLILFVLFVFWAMSALRGRQIFNGHKGHCSASRGCFQFSIFNKLSITNYRLLKKPDFYLLIFVIISVISIKNSSSYTLSAYNVLKLIEFVIFYFYIKSYAVYKFDLVRSMTILIAGGLFQAIIAILQFFKQSSLGLGLLGESVISLNLTGIASFYNVAGEKIIRAYGTTPHPNILAGYLFLAIFSFYFIYLYFHIYHKEKVYHPKLNYFLLGSYPLILLSFFFTFARVMIFLWFFGFIIRACLIISKKDFRRIFVHGLNRVKLTRILIIGTVVVMLFGIFYWPEAISRIKISSKEEAVQLRIFYNKESLKSLNWFGVGAGNFVSWLTVKDPNLPRNLYQPVHNIYLLIFSETGILGATALILFLIFLIKDFIVSTKMEKLYHYSFLIMFLSFLFVGLFDHFLWTLQQGRLMFWLLCALLAAIAPSLNKHKIESGG